MYNEVDIRPNIRSNSNLDRRQYFFMFWPEFRKDIYYAGKVDGEVDFLKKFYLYEN